MLDIVIPTWNNPDFFNPCIESILKTGVLNTLANIIVVNNGDQPISEWLKQYPAIKVLKPGKNLGWERGLDLALKNSESPFVVFQNDDTFIPKSSMQFYNRLLIPFSNTKVAAVSPVTTVASGPQSVFYPGSPERLVDASFLIFFTVMLRRKYIDEVGGIDLSLPGGDDIDLSMRLRKTGYNLLIEPDAFLIHHGFKSGNRLRGDHTVKGGWNSIDMIETTAHALIRKHGFKTYINTLRPLEYKFNTDLKDLEGDIVRSYVKGNSIVELGCGGKKTIDGSIGMDRVKNGDSIPNLPGQKSIADIVGDVQDPLPFENGSKGNLIARHLLEHCQDPLKTISRWNKVLKPEGRLIVAVPNEQVTSGIPMNPEHTISFTQESLSNMMKACGFKTVDSKDAKNGVSFVGCYEKVLSMDGQYE